MSWAAEATAVAPRTRLALPTNASTSATRPPRAARMPSAQFLITKKSVHVQPRFSVTLLFRADAQPPRASQTPNASTDTRAMEDCARSSAEREYPYNTSLNTNAGCTTFSDLNCLADEKCARGVCKTVCNSDASCGTNAICENRLCEIGCRSDSICPGDQACINERCQSEFLNLHTVFPDSNNRHSRSMR